MSDKESRNLAVVEALYAATGKGDWDAAEELMTDDFFCSEGPQHPCAGTYRGRGALRELFTKVMGLTEVVGLEVEQSTAGGDYVITLVDIVLAGTPQVRVPVAEMFRFRDGKVCEIKPYYFDLTPLLQAARR